tara:strand:- start:219 stop:419 length:201 start_codon:yes stop_codon:yes gene_type:complete
MNEVPLYPNGHPCRCSGACNYSKAFENAGKPNYIDYETYIKKDFIPKSKQQKLINEFLNTKYCLNK